MSKSHEPRLADDIAALIERGEGAAVLAWTEGPLRTAVGAARGELLLHVSAEACFSACGAEGGVCDALQRIGQNFRAAGDHASAIDTLEKARVIARAAEWPGQPARARRLGP